MTSHSCPATLRGCKAGQVDASNGQDPPWSLVDYSGSIAQTSRTSCGKTASNRRLAHSALDRWIIRKCLLWLKVKGGRRNKAWRVPLEYFRHAASGCSSSRRMTAEARLYHGQGDACGLLASFMRSVSSGQRAGLRYWQMCKGDSLNRKRATHIALPSIFCQFANVSRSCTYSIFFLIQGEDGSPKSSVDVSRPPVPIAVACILFTR